MKRKNQWTSRRGKTRKRGDFGFEEGPGSFGSKKRIGDGNDENTWARKRPVKAYKEGHSSYDSISHDVPSWHRDRFKAIDGGQGWPEGKGWQAKDRTSQEQPLNWGYGRGVGYGGGYGGFPAPAAGYGAGYGAFPQEQVPPQVDAVSPPIIPSALELIGKVPKRGLLPKTPVDEGPTPYELMKWSNELKARGGEPGVPRTRNLDSGKEFDLCWEYNTPQGCQRATCVWRHEPFIDEVLHTETEEDKSKRDDAMLQYFQKIDQVTQAHQVAPLPTPKPVVDAPESHLLDEPMDVINNDPVNNEPVTDESVINEPVNNEPLVASYIPPPIPPKVTAIVEKPVPKPPTIIRAPANVVTISPATVPNVAPPKIAPDLAPDQEEVKPEKKVTKEKSATPELKKKKSSSKRFSKNKPITKGKCCLLCRRRFKSVEMLKKHIKESELHRKNLKLRAINQALEKSKA